jgi:hypothetical protein
VDQSNQDYEKQNVYPVSGDACFGLPGHGQGTITLTGDASGVETTPNAKQVRCVKD